MLITLFFCVFGSIYNSLGRILNSFVLSIIYIGVVRLLSQNYILLIKFYIYIFLSIIS